MRRTSKMSRLFWAWGGFWIGANLTLFLVDGWWLNGAVAVSLLGILLWARWDDGR